MIFPVGNDVDGLWMVQGSSRNILRDGGKAAQNVAATGDAPVGYPSTFPACCDAQNSPTVAIETTSEASMQDNWKSIGELAKRIVEKQVRGK